MAITERFSAVDKAKMITTGNSLVVCGSTTAPEVNTSDLIKLDGTTTRNWTEAGSIANLNILINSTVLYAELVWVSTVFSNASGAIDLRSVQDNPITLTTSQGNYQITPQYTDSYIGNSGTVDRYRAADVTSYVIAAGSGNYTVSNVPISVPSTGLSNSKAGWSLTVIYRNDAFVPQKILYNSGISAATSTSPLQSTLTGFTTSSNLSELNGSVTMVCSNGTPLAGGEYVYCGPSYAQLSNIGNPVFSPNQNPGTAPNNAGNNFFGGIINVADPTSGTNGILNITGTNGTKNNDVFIPNLTLGGRNKWDITNVDISNTLVPNQTLLATQITTASIEDGIQLLVLGSQVAAKAPNITTLLEAYDIDGDGEYNAEVGDSLVYGIEINNSGDMDANNVVISSVINGASTFVPGSVVINGVANPTANITNGINLGTISAKGKINVKFTVIINSVPSGGLLYQNVNYSYRFISGINTITNYGKTNTMEVIVQSGLLSISKSASKSVVSVGDTVTYTSNITNLGTEIGRGLVFQDKIDSSSSFVAGSVVIDGINYSSYDPTQGFSLADLAVGEGIDVEFQVVVNSLPLSAQVNNVSCITFGYIYNQYEYLREKTIFSNLTSIQVQYTDVIGERCNNNNYSKVGDVVTYTLRLTNMGNISATNIQVLEPAIPGATFVTGSVNINGTSQPNLNPFNGFTLPSAIGPKQTTTVQYQVLINSIDPDNLIENTAQVPFKYQISPSSSVISSEIDSNTVDTVANYVCMNAVKSVDKQYATTDDILYYKVLVSNNGNINATDTVFLDSIQTEASFVPGSVQINGVSYAAYDPTKGFTLGTVCPEETVEVIFQVKVNSVPNPNIINNRASLVYSYLPDPNGVKTSNTIFSNTVQTTINKAQYTVVKSVDKAYAQLGDSLVYTTVIENTGTVPLTNMLFADYLGVWLSFYPGSVYINGVNYQELDPSAQFPIGNMRPGDTVTVIFAATIVNSPPIGYIPNTSEVILTYQENPDRPIITKTVYSNTVITYDPYASISLVKSVDKVYTAVGDTITYSFTATNTGNTAAINTFFADTIQGEASFVTGSVLVNDISMPSYNPVTGFTLGTMNAGQVVTIQFQVKVNSLPNPNTIKNSATTSYSYYVDPNGHPLTLNTTSNTVTTIVNSYSATLTKNVDKLYATVGDQLNYTVTLSNTGTVLLTSVNFIDIVPSGATFVQGSVLVNGISNPTADPNVGFGINNVVAGGNVVIGFKATVVNVPIPPQISNTANTTFQYQLTSTSAYINASLTSNTVTTLINQLTVTNTKSASKAYGTVGDTITYTSVLSNAGNVNLTNTNFIDNIPNHTTFVAGSVKINGLSYSSYDPSVGFTVGEINAGLNVTVTFDVTVNSVPDSGYITNNSSLTYQYKIDPNGLNLSGSAISNTTTTYINLGSLAVTKTADRSVVKLNNVITYSFVISNTGNTVLSNLLFEDTIQGESSFNLGSVYVNGVNQPTYNPSTGFSLSNLAIGQQATVTFQVTANSIPANNELFNTGNVTYSYYVDPNGNATIKTQESNTTTVYVYDTILSATKAVDKSIAKIGDALKFTITIENDGNTSAENIIFQDILDSNISFINDSVYVNAVQRIGYNPNIGFNLDNIDGGEITTITFEATINSRPIGNIIYNFGTVNYQYSVGSDVTTASMNTNTTQTYVAVGELTATKAVNKIYATVGDDLAYTIVVTNTGSVNAANISLVDLLPSTITFNPGTVVVDGIAQSSANPNTGFTLSDLTPNQYHTITFNVKVDSLPVSGTVINIADIGYTYQLTPTDTPVSTTTNSNAVTTNINIGNLIATKVVDKSYATIGDTLNYTITLNNMGNANCFQIFFMDIVQSNATFVPGSVSINGTAYPNYNPNTGFYLDNIAGYGSAIVTFAVTVNSLPSNYNINNNSTQSYQYYINPNNPAVIGSGISNSVTTIINVGSLTATKAVSKTYATLNDVLTYTVNIVNTGNIIANNVNFRDVIPTGLTLVAGSVTINGIAYSTYDPYASFTLGNISAGSTVVVQFNVRVSSMPNPSLASNTANLTFGYFVNPNGLEIIGQVNSNTVTTQINIGSITLTKSVDKAYSTMGYVLNYTVVVANTGNITANNVIFTDSLQSDVTFNAGSVKVNDTTHPDYDPTVGFTLGNIQPISNITVSFSVTVIANPTSNSVLNFAMGTFTYNIDPNGQSYSSSTQSNTVSTVIIKPSLTATKSVDKAYATLQDLLSYSILVKNSGNTPISGLFFSDSLSNGAVFNSGTVVVDGVSYPTYDPIAGFNMPNNLLAGITSLVQFQAIAETLPSPPQVTNYATSNGLYHIEPQGPSYPITATSNIVTTNINIGSLSNAKTVDKMYASVNDTVTYTSTITNTGNVNATNLFFTDSLQTELTYVVGTVSINGVVYPSYDPTLGFQLSDLAPNQTITVAFTAKINALPTHSNVLNTSAVSFSYKIDPSGTIITKNQGSNTVTTNVVLGKLNVIKVVDSTLATIGDNLTYTVTLTNVGNVIDSNVIFQDTPTAGVTFNRGSVSVNGVNQPTYDPTVGFSLGDIAIGNVVTVQFTVKVVLVPITNQVNNQATINFKYVVDPKQQPYSDTAYSNTVITNIAYGNLNVVKAVNKQYATIGDDITYTVTITNVGNINATNVVFLDPAPRNTLFELGSVTINGVSYPDYNPAAGFNLNTMTPGQISTVVYKVKVINLC